MSYKRGSSESYEFAPSTRETEDRLRLFSQPSVFAIENDYQFHFPSGVGSARNLSILFVNLDCSISFFSEIH